MHANAARQGLHTSMRTKGLLAFVLLVLEMLTQYIHLILFHAT